MPNGRLMMPSLALAVALLATAGARGAAPPAMPGPLLKVDGDKESNWVRTLALSPDGRQLAAVVDARKNADEKKPARKSADIELYQLGPGKPRVSVFPVFGSILNFFQFSRDGKRLLWTTYSLAKSSTARWVNYRLQVFDVAKGKVVHSIDLPDDTGDVVTLFPDDRTLALSGPGAAAVLFDLKAEKVIARLKGDEKYPDSFPKGFGETQEEQRLQFAHATSGFAVSRDGKRLAVTAGWGWLSVWDIATRKRLWHDKDGEHGRHLSLSFSPDGETLATLATRSNDLRFHHVKNGKQRFSVYRRCQAFAHYLPDGTMILDRGMAFRWKSPYPYGRYGFIRWEPVEDVYWGEIWDHRDVSVAPRPTFDIENMKRAVSANGHTYAQYGIGHGLVAYDLRKFWPRP